MRLLPNSLHTSVTLPAQFFSLFCGRFSSHLHICSLDHSDHGDSVHLKHGANDAQLESDFRRVLLTLVMVT